LSGALSLHGSLQPWHIFSLHHSTYPKPGRRLLGIDHCFVYNFVGCTVFSQNILHELVVASLESDEFLFVLLALEIDF
jgi:hypothetical protein